jgi:diguanylate cyclase (GGDEF)-like protein
MIKTLSFNLSFKIFQCLLALIIAFSAFLGHQFYQLNLQAKTDENQKLWIVSQLGHYHARREHLSFIVGQYLISDDAEYMEQYNLLNRKITQFFYSNMDGALIKREKGVDTDFGLFAMNEIALLKRIIATDLRLREIEAQAIRESSKATRKSSGLARENPNQVLLYKNIFLSEEYLKLNLNLFTLLQQVLALVDKRYDMKADKLDRQRSGLIFSTPGILMLNIGLLVFSFFIISKRMNEYHRELKGLTLKDFLTGVHNRKYLMEAGPQLLALNRREQSKVAVLMLDIDHFKHVNDKYGHDIGDLVLKEFSNSIALRMRKGDIFVRLGGEEFVLILNKVNTHDAECFANELRVLLSNQTLAVGQALVRYTVSIGVVMSDAETELAGLIRKADTALYQAKNTGRDQVVLFDERPITADNVGLTI